MLNHALSRNKMICPRTQNNGARWVFYRWDSVSSVVSGTERDDNVARLRIDAQLESTFTFHCLFIRKSKNFRMQIFCIEILAYTWTVCARKGIFREQTHIFISICSSYVFLFCVTPSEITIFHWSQLISPMLTFHIGEFDVLLISSVKLGRKDIWFEGNFNYWWILLRELAKLQKHKLSFVVKHYVYLSLRDIWYPVLIFK